MSYFCVFKRSLLGVKICLSHARRSPLGVKFKISDEHPRLFHMGVPPPWAKMVATWRVVTIHLDEVSILLVILTGQNNNNNNTTTTNIFTTLHFKRACIFFHSFFFLLVRLVQVITVEPRLFWPWLSGFLNYLDFFAGPDLVMNIY